MRSCTISAALIAIVAAACAHDVPTTASRPAPDAAAAVGPASITDAKITGKCRTSFAPPPFPLPPVIQQTDVGTCRLAHLGHADFHAQQVISFAAGTAVSNDMRFTAANGDVLMATSAGTFAPFGPGVRITALITFAGGTGRFANASGELQITGQADFSTNTTTFEVVEGRLSYTPADRGR